MANPPSTAGEQTHAHPKPNYVGVFAWLTGFTLVELFVSFMPAELDSIKVPLLVVFAILKASLVVLYYMHLRYDSRFYALLLLSGVFFAVLVGRFLPAVQK